MTKLALTFGEQLSLSFGPIRNSNLFSSHWLEHRLCLEPEWQELRAEAEAVLDALVLQSRFTFCR